MTTPDKRAPAKPGGSIGNRNALRHGLKGSKVPRKAKYVEHGVNKLRRQLEDLVLELKGHVSITDAAHVNSACKWERHSRLAAHWLRHNADTLSPSEVLRFSQEVASASDRRDKAIERLELDAPPEAPWISHVVDVEVDTDAE